MQTTWKHVSSYVRPYDVKIIIALPPFEIRLLHDLNTYVLNLHWHMPAVLRIYELMPFWW